MSSTYNASRLWWSVLLVCGVAAVGGCDPSRAPATEVPIQWTSIDSLNATLPSGVRVLAGRNDTIPLRAWAVRIRNPRRHSVEAIRSDEPDGVEPVSRFPKQADACVAVNGGYYDPNVDPIQPSGLFVVDGSVRVPPTDTIRRDTLFYPVARGAFGVLEEGTPDIAWTTLRDDTLFEWMEPPPVTVPL